MAGLLGYALAGGLAGYGNSLVEDAKAKREAAMEELRNSRLMEREDRQFDRQTQRDDTQFNRQSQRDDTQWERQQQRDDTQFQRGIDTSGKPVTVGDRTRLLRKDGSLGDITDGGEPFEGRIGESGAGLSSDENNQYRAIVTANTREVPNPLSSALPGEKTTDWDAVRTQLRSAAPSIYGKVFGADAAPAAGDATPEADSGDKPPPGYPDAKKAPDGQWYVQKDGKWHRIVAQ